MMEPSKFSVISDIGLERQRSIVGDNHPGLLALQEEARQLRCGQPCTGRGPCRCFSLDNIRDPEFCSEYEVFSPIDQIR